VSTKLLSASLGIILFMGAYDNCWDYCLGIKDSSPETGDGAVTWNDTWLYMVHGECEWSTALGKCQPGAKCDPEGHLDVENKTGGWLFWEVENLSTGQSSPRAGLAAGQTLPIYFGGLQSDRPACGEMYVVYIYDQQYGGQPIAAYGMICDICPWYP